MLNIINLQPLEPYGSNCYLLESNGEYAVIDPSADYLTVASKYPEIGGNVKYVLLTHSHFDHMLGMDSWSRVCEAVCVGADDAAALSDSNKNCYLGFLGVDDGYYGHFNTLSDGDILSLGDEKLKVIACPGHTPGGISIMVADKIFCGDTVFAQGGYGRCDLPGGDIDVLEKTLIRLITTMPGECTFYPGHGPITTLRELVYYFM